ncbi:Xylanolytic transcriptional activator xlnR like protein [Verticillium longisporum]|nr:Xylanolytic transcriptional activator xlnR like protein [Verticillium longisporum]
MDSQASTPTAAAAARVSKSAQHPAESASGSSPQRMSRKRSLSTANGDTLGSPGSDDTITHNHGRGSKGHKVSRACDHCKQRKAKCSGTIPCATCSSRGLTCLYAARYSRGRPPTPPPSRDHHPAAPVHHVNARLDHQTEPRVTVSRLENTRVSANRLSESVPASRASPELGMAEIEGQVFDPTSGVTFLHRAWKRLAKHDGAVPVNDSHAYASVQHQPVMLAGDRPLPQTSEEDIYRLNLPGHQDLVDLLAMYFDVCIATYHIVHRPTVQIAQIISKISREVYSIKPISEEERISAAHRLSKEVHEWKESLPPYLGSIHPSMLVPSFRRKSIVLKLGYSHAIMHANRLFLLATVYPESETQIAECLGAARSVMSPFAPW